MKIDIIDVDEFVKINHLKQVTSGVLLQRGQVPHPDGLLSNDIFGITVKSRRETFAYIDLHGHFFHPHIYKVVHSMFRNIDKIINGEKFYSINEEGILVEDKINGETGLEFIYNNWENITWKKSGDNGSTVGIRAERVGLLEHLKKSEIFISKMIVIPVFYRDVTNTSKGGESGELNKYYAQLIRLTTLLEERELFAIEFNATRYNIQQQIMNIYNYFKVKVEKKNGMIRRYLMGKTVDNATRVVITAPNFHAERPEDLMVDYTHAAVPISQICALAYPFMMQWLKEYFMNNVISQELSMIVYDPEHDLQKDAPRLKDPALYFDESYIKNMMDSYIRDASSRFNPIEIPVEGSTHKYYLRFTGKRINGKEELSSIMYRKMTITDLLYMAAVATTEDKMLMTTRYPMRDEFSIINNKIRVNSTTKTEPMMVGERIYKWYPVIEPDTPAYKMASLFVDSLQFSESYLAGLNGDYDGDQCTEKILFSQEANEELEKYINSTAAFINAAGSMYRPIESEATQTYYTFTKNPPSDKKDTLSAAQQKQLLEMKSTDFTFTRLVEMFGTTFDANTKKQKNPEYNMYATMTIPKNHFMNSSEIKTTVGRYIFYEVIIVDSNLQHIVPFEDVVINQKQLSAIESKLGRALQEENITTTDMANYIRVRDWFGLQMHGVVCTSITPGTLFISDALESKKQAILKANKEKLDEGDPAVGEKVEKELQNAAREIIGEDPGMDLFDSGARGSFGNNYKNIYLIRGLVYNEGTKKYDFIKNSLLDGLNKDDIAAHANVLVNGAYPKSIGTADSGYLGKQLNAIMQTIVLDDDKESDCGTTFTLDVLMPSGKAIHDYDYRFIVENKKLVCLTPDIIDSYAGKSVKMRSVMFCKNEFCKCSRCAGLYYYKIGKKFIGLQSQKAATQLTDLNMKKFHVNQVKTSHIDASTLITG